MLLQIFGKAFPYSQSQSQSISAISKDTGKMEIIPHLRLTLIVKIANTHKHNSYEWLLTCCGVTGQGVPGTEWGFSTEFLLRPTQLYNGELTVSAFNTTCLLLSFLPVLLGDVLQDSVLDYYFHQLILLYLMEQYLQQLLFSHVVIMGY